MTERPLRMWTIYCRPKDYPDGFVVRGGTVTAAGFQLDVVAQYVPDLATARALVPQGLYNLGRKPGDDPAIAEVWV